MDDYVFLLNQIASYLNSQFSEIPQEIQERISQAGMGGKTEAYPDGVEEFEWAYIGAENKYLSDKEAKEIEESKGIRKGKGIRPKTKTEHYYIWDKLLPLEREYKVARYDFENFPDFKEKAPSSKLVETITPYLESNFSDLPQEIKMKIAIADKFQLWNEKGINRRVIAENFDIHMLPDSDPNMLIGLYGIRNEWDKYARKSMLLAEEARPLMNGLDPESWEEHKNDQKELPKDMIRSIDRCLGIAKAEGKCIDTPFKWLAWGRIHDLDKPTIKSNELLDESDVCMWGFFESSVNRHAKQPDVQNEDNNGRRQIQQEKEILRIIQNVLRLDPLNLPKRPKGKPWIKAEVRKYIEIPNQPFQSDTTFDKAWSRLLQQGKLKITTD